MARHRDFFYNEDDIEQIIDGYGTSHCVLDILDLANTDPALDLSVDEYFYFMNIQSGKDNAGSAKPTVEQWEYVYFGSQFFTLIESGTTATYYSFPVMMTDSWLSGLSGTETFPIQLVILAGGTT